jgi:hypothetical protein
MDFKFEIGQYVTPQSHLDLYGIGNAQPMRVVQRALEEDEGGVQRHYNCRVYNPPDYAHLDHAATTYGQLLRFSESELVAITPIDYRRARKMPLEDRQAEHRQEMKELFGREDYPKGDQGA